ncbi:MAG: glycosyltransferase family 4 protein [Pirellulales bacterium]|nr:glycosyltransferase family 4 protein [Pirellulales bacterium]
MSEKSTILFLIDNFYGPEGGTEQYLLFLQKELPRDRFDLHFGILCRLQRLDFGVFPVEPVVLYDSERGGRRGAFRRLVRLARLIQEVKADVVHTFSPTSELYAALAVLLARRGTVLGSRRNLGYWHTWRSRWTARLLAPFRIRYAANCEAVRESAAKLEWIPRRRISVIPNAAPSKRWIEGLAHVPARSSLGIRDGEQVVAMVATVRPVKDYATFLRAARLVIEQHPATRFLVVGFQEPRYYAELRRLADELNVAQSIQWLGPVKNPFSILAHCDVGVLSSRSEGFSNALLEYAVAGIAAVATDVGGSREVVQDGVTGFLVPPKSPERMAERICVLLRDDALRKTFGARAAARATALFSKKRVLQQYSQLYLRLAGKTAVACSPGAIADPAGKPRSANGEATP